MPSQPRTLQVLNIMSALLLAAGFWFSLGFAPTEKTMGAVQRVFYFHVSTAWVGMIGFIIAAVAGLIYLYTKNLKWDRISVVAVEISLVFFFITIVLGSIWARPIWNAWWTWEPRLTSAAVLEMTYLAYLLLRQGIEDPQKRATFGAVYNLLGGVSVPVTFMAIRLFRSIHPVVIGGSQNSEKMGMTSDMFIAMAFCMVAFSVIFVTLFWHRLRLASLAEKVEILKLQAMQ